MKRTICFTVIYIGELKFFERFFSHFEDEYDIHLLFIRPDDNKRRQMIEYSKENRYTFTVIDYDLGGNRRGEKRIPVVSALIRYRKHIKSARAFFNKHNIGRFVGAKISFTNQTFFREANYRGIQTVLVQRGHRPPLDSYVRIKKLKPLKRTYAFFIDLMRKVIEMITFGPRYAFTSIMPSKVGAIGEEGKMNAQSAECIAADAGARSQGAMAGSAIAAGVAVPAVASIPYVGWLAGGWALLLGQKIGSEAGSQVGQVFNDC